MTAGLCKKCLVGMEAEEYGRMIGKAVAAVPARDRVSDGEYARRIALCEDCEAFFAATCRACGCYVELRAVKKSVACPRKKW